MKCNFEIWLEQKKINKKSLTDDLAMIRAAHSRDCAELGRRMRMHSSVFLNPGMDASVQYVREWNAASKVGCSWLSVCIVESGYLVKVLLPSRAFYVHSRRLSLPLSLRAWCVRRETGLCALQSVNVLYCVICHGQ
jgi:hypothetical protein